MAIKKGTLDELLSGRDPKQVFSKDGLFDELKKALAERVLNAELDEHLDGEAAAGKANHRNGYSKKTVLTGSAKLDLRIPRDREGTFDPKLIARYQRRFPGFDEKIVSMYPLVFFDALRVKIRDEGLVRNKAVYIALGVMADGTKDILGLWIETS